MMKIIWITWEKQRRNEGLALAVGAKFYELISDKNRVYRYLDLVKTTFIILIKDKPDVVIVQNPSIVLSLMVVIFKKILKYNAIVDAHNSGIFPCESRSLLLNHLSTFIQRNACLTIVTNHYLCSHVEKNGGKGFVLPDRIPTPSSSKNKILEGKKKIVFICTYSTDEPYMEVIEAAKKLGDGYTIYFTGNYKGKISLNAFPKNVMLLGFLPEEEYWDTLNSSDVIMDLTTREDCLVCGAYEGLSLGKPLILSNTRINREYFRIGCVYVDSNSQSIRYGIQQCFSNYKIKKSEMNFLRKILEEEWEHKMAEFSTQLTKIRGT